MRVLTNRDGPGIVLLCILILVMVPVQGVGAEFAKAAKTPSKTFANNLGMAFVYVPPGTFLMGSPPDEIGRDLDETQYQVTLTEGFYLQETEVTQAQWKTVMGGNPSLMKDPDCPVTNISWVDALAFIARLNQIEETDTYRLPKEAEWEWACRSGSYSAFPGGPVLSTDQANYDGNHPYGGYEKGVFRRGTTRGGTFTPNKWGLYDMGGNVWEWCEDVYSHYPSKPEMDPGGASTGVFRVVRGGSWYYDIQSCRCASRHKADPSRQSIVIGFRTARSLR